MQIENKIRVGRRIFLPKLGYYEFKQVNGVPPTVAEIESWMDRHKSQVLIFNLKKLHKFPKQFLTKNKLLKII